MKVGIIILAAGESKRMGVPKQLLDVQGDLLVVKLIKEALSVDNVLVTVVLGAHKDLIMPKLSGLPINIVENPLWETGIASSIIRGLAGTYMLNKNIDAVLVMTSDMPEVNSEYLKHMILEAKKTDKFIVASQYKKTVGVPVLFKKETFTILLNLKGDSGARQILKENQSHTKKISFLGTGIDLDTKEDYLNYLDAQN